METYWQLPQRQRLNLTNDELDVYIKREVVTQGLLVPKEPTLMAVPTKPDIEYPKGTLMFQVKSFKEGDSYSNHTFSALFAKIEDAEKFMECKPVPFDSKYRKGPNAIIVKPVLRYEIEAVTTHSEKEIEEYDDVMSGYEKIVDFNESANSQYRQGMGRIRAASEKIMTDRQKLREHRARMENVITNLHEFVEIADNNVSLAVKFMCKKENMQLVFDALNEIPHDYVWDTIECFGGECLIADLNPYRDIKPPSF